MQETQSRNNRFFEVIINGGVIAHVAKQEGLTDQTVRRIFLRECLKRAPEVFVEGKLSEDREPTLTWIRANAARFQSQQMIGQGAIDTMLAIRLLEQQSFEVVGIRPFDLNTPLVAFEAVTPSQKAHLASLGIHTLEDAAQAIDLKKKVWNSSRQFGIVEQLISLAMTKHSSTE